MTPTQTTGKSTDSTIVVINRIAIDPSGQVGSLYDGYRDHVLGQAQANWQEKPCQKSEVRRCEVKEVSKIHSSNVLQIESIEVELRLSILLDREERHGIAPLINYSLSITEYTRLLCYTYVDRIQQLSAPVEDIRKSTKTSTSHTTASHVITGLDWGIDVIVVLQLPYDAETVREIDRVLQRIRTLLLNEDNAFLLTSNEENLLGKIINTKVYSNTPELRSMTAVRDVCRYIEQNKNSTVNHPVSYTLRPIKWLYPHYTGKSTTFIALPEELNDNIEQYVLQLRTDTKKLENSINEDVRQLLCGHLKEPLSKVQKQWVNVQTKYKNEIERLFKLVTDVRSGRVQVPTVDQALKNHEQIMLKKNIHDLTQYVNDLKDKGHFISYLNRQHFKYVNVAESDIDRTDNQKTIERKLIMDDQRDCILCSNDELNKIKPRDLNKLRDDLVNEFKSNSNLRLIYADFSYGSYTLLNMVKLPSEKYKNQQNKPKQNGTTSFRELPNTVSSSTKAQTIITPHGETQTFDPVLSKPQITDPLSTKSQTIITTLAETQTFVPVPAKVQLTDPLSAKAQRYITPPGETQTFHPVSTKLQITGPSSIKPQITTPLSTKAQTIIIPLAETQTFVPVPTKVQFTDPLSTKTHTHPSSPRKVQISIPQSTEVQTHISASTKLQTYALSPRKAQTFDSSPRKPINPTVSFSDNDTINILLLGETGVGKSTFINAFVNYLTFGSLKQAQSGRPVALIPVSFLITVGDHFEERIVRFGDVDSSNNEDFDHPGQSVTQRCRSYVFHLPRTNGKKLRIIDTPGFGDTRGIDQDDRNMRHTLEYVNNLPHINAVCFLLKPNASRLNIFFRSCLTQLFDFLDPNARGNIIFCFTNARSTFYTPGDTAPLLKQMLASLSIGDIPFKKENAFCFDNESFRYLMALQNKIHFSDEEKREYQMSWSTSVTESNRLIDYISRKLHAYHIDGSYQSIKHAEFEIVYMIRPMLETMRNILRNLILNKMNSSKASIELHPKVSNHPIIICLICKSAPIPIGNFWIAADLPHHIEKNCRNCECSHNQHTSIDYILEYEFSNHALKYDQNQMNEMLNDLCYASVQFSYFLIHVACSYKDDPFLSGLLRMIREEVDILDIQKTSRMNSELVKQLEILKSNYEQRMNEMKLDKKINTLPVIYKQIKYIREYPIVCEQIAAVKEGQKMMMKQNEYEVP